MFLWSCVLLWNGLVFTLPHCFPTAGKEGREWNQEGPGRGAEDAMMITNFNLSCSFKA